MAISTPIYIYILYGNANKKYRNNKRNDKLSRIFRFTRFYHLLQKLKKWTLQPLLPEP